MVIKSSIIEQEVIILKAVKELIDSMVNFQLMSLLGNDPDSNILFESSTHQKFFNIILVDFLSCTDPMGPVKQTSYLGGLREIVNNPSFDENNSVHNLKIATQEFKDWLEQEVEVNVWLPSIDKATKLNISRFDFLKMTGNISKHNYLRAIDLPPKGIPLLKLELPEFEPQEQVAGSPGSYEDVSDCTPSATAQSIPWLQSEYRIPPG